MPTQAERDRNRNFATTLVSAAIMLMGVAFLAIAFVLLVRGGFGGFFMALILGAVGFAIVAGGFFFQLVPLRVDKLAEEKRDYDARTRGPGYPYRRDDEP